MLKEAFYAQYTFNVKSSPFSTELKEIFMLFLCNLENRWIMN